MFSLQQPDHWESCFQCLAYNNLDIASPALTIQSLAYNNLNIASPALTIQWIAYNYLDIVSPAFNETFSYYLIWAPVSNKINI